MNYTLSYIHKLFEEFFNSHSQVNHFHYGVIEDYMASKEEKDYISVNVEFTGTQFDETFSTHSYTISISDLFNQNYPEMEHSVISNTAQIMRDFLSFLRDMDITFTSGNIQPFREDTNDFTAGVVMVLGIQVPNQLNECSIPGYAQFINSSSFAPIDRSRPNIKVNADFATIASYALTASYALNGTGTVDTGSFVTTASFNSYTASIISIIQSNTGSRTNRPTSGTFIGQKYYQTDELIGEYWWNGSKWKFIPDEDCSIWNPGISALFGTATSSGSGASGGSISTGNSIVSFTINTGTTSLGWGLSQNGTMIYGTADTTTQCIDIYFPSTGSVDEQWIMYIGDVFTAVTEPTDGNFFSYIGDGTGKTFNIHINEGGAAYSESIAFQPRVNNIHRFVITQEKQNFVEFWIDGVLYARKTSAEVTLPIGGITYSCRAGIRKLGVGTTAIIQRLVSIIMKRTR